MHSVSLFRFFVFVFIKIADNDDNVDYFVDYSIRLTKIAYVNDIDILCENIVSNSHVKNIYIFVKCLSFLNLLFLFFYRNICNREE